MHLHLIYNYNYNRLFSRFAVYRQTVNHLMDTTFVDFFRSVLQNKQKCYCLCPSKLYTWLYRFRSWFVTACITTTTYLYIMSLNVLCMHVCMHHAMHLGQACMCMIAKQLLIVCTVLKNYILMPGFPLCMGSMFVVLSLSKNKTRMHGFFCWVNGVIYVVNR